MENNREITVVQAASILISTIIGVGVLPLPEFAARAGNSGAPLVTLMGILVALFGLWIITKLGIRFPNQSIISYSEKIIGKIPGKLLSILFILFFAILTGLASREFGEVVITAVMDNTPLEVTVIVMLLMAAITTRNDMNTFSYIHTFYLPIILAPGLIIVVLSLKNANILYLQPIWGNAPHSGMLWGILTVAALFQGSFVMSIVIPSMTWPEKAMKASIWAIIISGALYLLIVMATVSIFGPEEMEELFWPTLELARTTSIPGNILQRLDIVFLAVWVTAVFTTLLSTYKFTIQAMGELIKLKDHKMLSFFMFPIIFVIAMLPQNIVQMYKVIIYVGRMGLLLTIVCPLMLLIIAALRKVNGRKAGE